jgi:S-adenosylmethionine hydrolase
MPPERLKPTAVPPGSGSCCRRQLSKGTDVDVVDIEEEEKKTKKTASIYILEEVCCYARRQSVVMVVIGGGAEESARIA